MSVYGETVHPRESSQHGLRHKGWDEKEKHVQGERGQGQKRTGWLEA